VQTKKDDEHKPVFNDFAWRVGEENTMMIALAKELGLTLELQTTPVPQAEEHAPFSDKEEGEFFIYGCFSLLTFYNGRVIILFLLL
jgi:hypothetical protein